MRVKNLADIDFEDLVLCFLKSFKNYFVEMPTDVDYYRNRFKAARVRYDLSYGMFEDDKLIGFIVHGIDTRDNETIAYNTGTGVLPEYRGRRIVQTIYDHAIRDLKKNGITLCSLEVIKENEIALKCYKKIGFEICRTYNCYNGSIEIKGHNNIDLREIEYSDLKWEHLPNQAYYSWDNHKNSLKLGSCHYYEVEKMGTPIGYFAMIPENGYLAQFEVYKESIENWNTLFTAIKSVNENIKINNVDERLIEKGNFLTSIGLENTIDQFEMELKI